MTYGGVYYSACTSDTYSWCATSTNYEGGSYLTYAYCGYGKLKNFEAVCTKNHFV